MSRRLRWGIMALNLCVLYGSVRINRVGIRAARFVMRFLTDRGHHVTLIDPAEYQLPLLEKMYKSYKPGTAPEPLPTLKNLYDKCDGYVMVTGEWNHTIPPALTNLLDHFLEEYYYRPAGIVSYSAGAYGGVRGAMALRPMLSELGMVSLPTAVAVPKVQDAFAEDGTPTTPADEAAWNKRFGKFAAELEWYGEALKAARASGTPA